MGRKNEHRHARVAGAYAKTRGLRGALAPRLRRTRWNADTPPDAPRAASDAETMRFADRPLGRRGARSDDLRSNVARGFGLGIGFAAGTALFRVVVFIIAFGALMAALLAAFAAVL